MNFPILEETPYAGGHFRIKLVLSRNFPQEPPKGFFLTKIFHPNVASNGEICVNTLKKDWNPQYGIKHILLVNLCTVILVLSTCYRAAVPNIVLKCTDKQASELLMHSLGT